MKIKAHIKKHKYKYGYAATVIATAGITWLIMRSNIARGEVSEGIARGEISNTASFNFRSPNTVNVITVLERDGRGHPGYPVRNVETKHVFLSQHEAARAFGVSESLISGHLNGKFPDVDGLHFERVNIAA